MTTKTIEFSYPSSTNSKKFGYEKTGCYTVELIEPMKRLPRTLKAFATKEEAKIFADTLPQLYSTLYLYHLSL